MPYQVTISSVVSGASPYDIWICDTCLGTCIYQTTITTTPYTFTLPELYETYPSYVIKLIDDNGCTYCETASVTYKQFETGEYFEFQGGEEFQFQ